MSPTDQFLKEGLLGAIIVVLFGVCALLWKSNNTLSNKLIDQAKENVVVLLKLKDDYFNSLTAFKDAYFNNQQSQKDVIENVLNVVMALKEKIK